MLLTVGITNHASAADMVFACSKDNDLFQIVSKASKNPPVRFDSAADALREAKPGSAILILADDYPQKTTEIPTSVIDDIKAKKLRLYIEYPSALPGIEFEKPQSGHYERAVIASDFFDATLPKLRILAINGLRFLPTDAQNPSIVAAKVAGFDTAVYGLPEKTYPILFTCCNDRILVSTTKLSHFITGRYAPQDAWEAIWQGIFKWLQPEDPPLKLTWQSTTMPTYRRDEALPSDTQRQAVHSGAEWFKKAKLLIHPDRLQAIKENKGLLPAPTADTPLGDGSLGLLEAPLSVLEQDGSQRQSKVVRSDCCTESAMALAFDAKLNGVDPNLKIAENLLDFTYFTSDACKGGRGDPENPAYGHVAWGMTSPDWLKANYGDDNARVILSTIAVAAITGEDRWNESLIRCILANLRTTGQQGFRPSRIDMEQLEKNGWQHYYQSSCYHPSAHFQAYLWACYLWAYDKTGDQIFLDKAKRGIREFMNVYPNGIRWTNGLAQERARIILPLAWLLRVENTPENRQLLDKGIDGLLSLQAPCGAIREELGPLDNGAYPPPKSNEGYGGTEAPLIQENGDPVADMLYTTNFAFLGLREASGATGNDPKIRKAEDRLAEFLCRIQVQSDVHPSVDGGWFRAFDFKRWEFWGSNADAGWGAWSIESGWTNGWITSVLAMREMETTLWDLSKNSKIEKAHKKYREQMLPQEFVDANRPKAPQKIDHAAKGTPVKLATPPSHSYPGNGAATLTDGVLAPPTHSSGCWLGFEGHDIEAIIELGTPVQVKDLAVNCLQISKIGIFLPSKVDFAVSEDGKLFSPVGMATHKISPKEAGPLVETLSIEGNDKMAKFVRVRVKNPGALPSWHRSPGQMSWLFIDEIVVNRKSN